MARSAVLRGTALAKGRGLLHDGIVTVNARRIKIILQYQYLAFLVQ
jgi:hypothetical protein